MPAIDHPSRRCPLSDSGRSIRGGIPRYCWIGDVVDLPLGSLVEEPVTAGVKGSLVVSSAAEGKALVRGGRRASAVRAEIKEEPF
jgi:hypothetical protein